MDRNTAGQISQLVRTGLRDSDSFRCKEQLETPLAGFHQWADERDCVGAFRISSDTSELYLLFIQWSREHPSRFHLIAYEANRSRILFEAHEIRDDQLRWAYQPAKRDGRNSERKEKFAALATQRGLPFADSRVAIPVPRDTAGAELFLSTVFLLADIRTEADGLDRQLEVEPNVDPRYWLMALGPGAKHWDECRREGIACLGWDDLGDITGYESREAMGLGPNSSLACWQFCHDMKPGDTIFAKLGTTSLVGHGTVLSAYRFDPARQEYKNVRDIDWHSNFPGGVPVRDQRLATKTLTDVSGYPNFVDDLKRAVGILPPLPEAPAEPPYTIDSILEDGCFLDRSELDTLLNRLETKKNLVLQGPPGTGKTWLAKRIAYALIGRRDRERICSVQFHPTLSYEDFVLGWRPSASGLELTNGIFLRAIESASADEKTPFVVVIEEINRGNPAQVFGEMLTLLENDKRSEEEAIELAYRHERGERVFIPHNLFVIGTMNIADRSLALVDLALRRRFAFVTLETALNESWHRWCVEQAGIDEAVLAEIRNRMVELNDEIAADRSLGAQFRIGHSYVTPAPGEEITDARRWFRGIVETEIGPLLEEYWFDNPDKAATSKTQLLQGL